MSITANASPSEMNSPFYKDNEDFASEFENYIAERGGEVTGRYNAWSYHVKGRIDQPRSWILQFRKSTITSQGNLLLSSEYQSLLVLVNWATALKSTPETEFVIRRKRKRDLFFRFFDRSLTTTKVSEKYLVKSSVENPLISTLTDILKPQFDSGPIYRIQHRKNRLEVEMRTKDHHFDTFEKLVDAVENNSQKFRRK